MWRNRFCVVVALSGLAGCGNNPPVPVVEGGAPVVVEAGHDAAHATPAAACEGSYLVKKGDNLYRIARANGVTQQDLVAWNNLTDETKIEVGQELRVVPPEGVVEVRPIAAPAPIVVVGDGSASTGSAVATGTELGNLVGEPRGGKIAYSDTALAQARAMENAPAAAKSSSGSVVTTGQTGPGPMPLPGPVSPPKPAPAPAPVSATTDGVDWTWPIAGNVIRGFVEGGNGNEMNRGVDLSGRKGEPIHAAATGKVTFVGTLRGYGDFLVIRHNADYISVYAHTSKILVKRDQDVVKGQKIAEVGSSDADRPQLHFEIRHKSEPVDPVKLLPARQ
jgi:lipoprotein NlpD